MRFVLADSQPLTTPCDLLALPVPPPGALQGEAAEVDRAFGGRLSEVAKEEGFTGRPGGTVLFHSPEKPAHRVLLVGVGSDASPERLRRYAAVAVRRSREVHAARLALVTRGGGSDDEGPADERVRAVTEGAGLGAYRFDRYRTVEDEGTVEEVLVLAGDGDRVALRPALRAGEVAVEATCRVRDLVNEPANVLTPTALAEAARDIARRGGLESRVIDLAEAQAMGMGLFAAVAAGSAEPAKVIILEYRPESTRGTGGPARTVALVGKGITFDSGGLSIKVGNDMKTMKYDMAGAGAVLGTMGALRDLAVPLRVLGIAAATENMISGRATRPGDIVRGMGGKTVEITNTDAEGRLVLADVLTYAVRAGATEIIDLATLTGACIVGLGSRTAGLMGNDQPLMDRLLRAAALAGEQLWQLPLYEEFLDAMRGEISDLKNAAPGRAGEAERAAAFLREFVGTTPWAHLDIAGPAFAEEKSNVPYIAPGGTGYGVRTLLHYLAAPM